MALKYLTTEELRAFDSAIPKGNIRDRLLFMFMSRMGLRVGEVVGSPPNLPGIHTEDIDWERRNLYVRGKGKKIERKVPIQRDVFDLLLEYVAPYEPAKKTGKLIDITTHQVRNLTRKYAENAGITRRINPHKFRHTFAVNWLESGANLRTLQLTLGHSSLSTTEQYLMMTETDVRNDMEKMTVDIEKRLEETGKELTTEQVDEIKGHIDNKVRELMDRIQY